MKNKNVILLVVGFVLILIGAFLCYKGYYYECNNKCIEEKPKENTENKNENEDLPIGKTCEYTRTYRFVDYYDYEGTVPSVYFIVFDTYQAYSPIILELNKNDFPKNFEKGKNYEITYRRTFNSINTTYGNGIDYREIITKIEETDKEGMDQVQDSCIFN